MTEKKMQTISKDMQIAKIIEMMPEAVDMMMDIGLHCAGCSANTFENLEQGMSGHGFTTEDIDDFVYDLNDLYTEINSIEEGKSDSGDCGSGKCGSGGCGSGGCK